MGPPLVVVVFYISGHGLGHATRDVELVRVLSERRKDAHVIIRTMVARDRLLASSRIPLTIEACEADTGAVQRDSLTLDIDETARRAAAFYADFDRRADQEAAYLSLVGATLVLADIPPLAFAAAGRAGVPSVAIGNFTWDWIYEDYPAFARLAPGVIPTIERAYAGATLALRLPLHGGFAPMAAVTREIPMIARTATHASEDTRRAIGVFGDRPLVLASFGGDGARLPYAEVERSGRLVVIPTDRRPPPGFFYEDLVAAADVVVTKPGYGIISECAANDTAILYTSRGHFVEYDVLVADMPRYVRCRFISREELLAGRWLDGVEHVLAQPRPAERPRTDGASVAADIILQACTAR